MKKIAGYLLIYFLSAGILSAQDIELGANVKGKEKAITLSDLSVSVVVSGNVATTTFDLLFYNPNDRILEGNLSFPLQEDQEIVRYALDINGKLREGVVIEKVKARQVFEAVVRQNIDPGIVEKTKGNFFKTRIYPVPAKGYKRVVIAVDEQLKFKDQDFLIYKMPLRLKYQLKKFELNVKVTRNLGKPTLINDFGNVTFDQASDFYQLSYDCENYNPPGEITFSIPFFQTVDQLISTEEFENEKYFMLNFKKKLEERKARKSPNKIAVYWDNSFSGKDRNIVSELSFLKNYLESIKGKKEVLVYAISNQLKKMGSYQVYQDASQLVTFLQNLNYDGATDFEHLKFSNEVDENLLFSDGVVTLGTQTVVIPKSKIHTINSVNGADVPFLKYLAEETGGSYIPLNSLNEKDAFSLIKKTNRDFFKISCLQCEDILISSSSNAYHTIFGKYKSNHAEVKIQLGKWNTKYKVIENEFSLGNVARSWAREQIKQLEKRFDVNKNRIQELGKQFNIVTRNTSFIVLDRVEDYVTYEINPPRELKDAYRKLLMEKKRNEKLVIDRIHEDNLNRLVNLKTWYNKEFKLEDFEAKKRKRAQLGNSSSTNERVPDLVEESSIVESISEEVDDFRVDELELESFDEEESEADSFEPVAEAEANKAKDSSGEGKPKQSITVLPWQPTADYLDALASVTKQDYLSTYLKFRKQNLERPSFYLQVSNFFFQKSEIEMSNRILSTLLETDLENPELLKIVGNTFLIRGEHQLAIKVFEEIKELRPEEPQSYRDLALALEANENYQEALELYNYILRTNWDRFNEIKDIVFVEMNALVSSQKGRLDLKNVESSYIFPVAMDVRVAISWSSNDNDIDLWVVDPVGEKCYYSYQQTSSGGRFSNDFTNGYGPESFKQKKAIEGEYEIFVNYFGDSRQTVTGPVTIFATFYTNYGKSNQQKNHQVIQLSDDKETLKIGVLNFLK